MKKILLVSFLSVFVLFGCAKKNLDNVNVTAITDLSALQTVIGQVSEAMNAWTIPIEKAETLIEQLQQKYIDLTAAPYQKIEDQFANIQKIFTTKAITLYTLPLRAKRLWMTYPQGMQLNKQLSKQIFTNETGYSSTTLIYTGSYMVAMQQAKIIAQKAHLFVSKNFAQAQSLAQIGNIDYISGLDVGGLAQGIVYVNHELLDTNIDTLLSVSVDQNGVLTIEATKYK